MEPTELNNNLELWQHDYIKNRIYSILNLSFNISLASSLFFIIYLAEPLDLIIFRLFNIFIKVTMSFCVKNISFTLQISIIDLYDCIFDLP